MSRPFKRPCEVCRCDTFHDAMPVGADFLYACHDCHTITGSTAKEPQCEFNALMNQKREATNRARQRGQRHLRGLH